MTVVSMPAGEGSVFAADAFDHVVLPHIAPDGTIVTAIEVAPDGLSALITIAPAGADR